MKLAAYPAILIVLISLGFNFAYLFRHGWKGPSRLRAVLIKALVVFYAVMFIWIPLDVFFYFAVVQSDNFAFTLASERWLEENWRPRNDQRYRDDDIPDDIDEREVIFVVGDSFVAAHGVADYKQRFTNKLGEKLGDEYAVLNIARNGWNTLEQFAAIAQHPLQPDHIILSYYLNDIEDAANFEGMKRPDLIQEPPKPINKIVEKSYFVNWAWWRVARNMVSNSMIEEYAKFRESMFADEAIWARHAAELRRITEYCRWRGIKLDVVIWPDLTDIEGTRAQTEKVAALFKSEGVDVLNLSDQYGSIAQMPTDEVILGPHDAHPNERTHEIVADKIFKKFFE